GRRHGDGTALRRGGDRPSSQRAAFRRRAWHARRPRAGRNGPRARGGPHRAARGHRLADGRARVGGVGRNPAAAAEPGVVRDMRPAYTRVVVIWVGVLVALYAFQEYFR